MTVSPEAIAGATPYLMMLTGVVAFVGGWASSVNWQNRKSRYNSRCPKCGHEN